LPPVSLVLLTPVVNLPPVLLIRMAMLTQGHNILFLGQV
jgi:hypothetical protein